MYHLDQINGFSVIETHSSDLNVGRVEFRKSYLSFEFMYFTKKRYTAFIVSVSVSEFGIARHRILTGTSVFENGKFNFCNSVNLDCLAWKYVWTISVSDKNPNLSQTKS